MSEPQKTIRIITHEELEAPSPRPEIEPGAKQVVSMDGQLGWDMEVREVPSPQSSKTGGVQFAEVSVEKLEQELAKFMKTVDQLFSRASIQANMQEMNLAEIELCLTVSATGSISVGMAGGNISGSNSIVLRFRQK